MQTKVIIVFKLLILIFPLNVLAQVKVETNLDELLYHSNPRIVEKGVDSLFNKVNKAIKSEEDGDEGLMSLLYKLSYDERGYIELSEDEELSPPRRVAIQGLMRLTKYTSIPKIKEYDFDLKKEVWMPSYFSAATDKDEVLKFRAWFRKKYPSIASSVESNLETFEKAGETSPVTLEEADVEDRSEKAPSIGFGDHADEAEDATGNNLLTGLGALVLLVLLPTFYVLRRKS